MSDDPNAVDMCGARAALEVGAETRDVECILPPGHDGEHYDETLGEWSEAEVPTTYPDGKG